MASKHNFYARFQTLSPCLSKGQAFKRGYISEGRLSKTEVCTEYFPLIFFFLLSLCFFSLLRRNVYFSSLRERPGGSGPDLGAHNSPGPADSCINHSPLELIGGSIKIQPPASDHPGSLYRNRSIQSYLTQLKLYSHLRHLAATGGGLS